MKEIELVTESGKTQTEGILECITRSLEHMAEDGYKLLEAKEIKGKDRENIIDLIAACKQTSKTFEPMLEKYKSVDKSDKEAIEEAEAFMDGIFGGKKQEPKKDEK